MASPEMAASKLTSSDLAASEMSTLAPPPPAPAGAPVAPGAAGDAGDAAPPPDLDERRAGSVVASQWRLMYSLFRRHRLAVVATFIGAAFYLVAAFCEFVAPMDPNKISNQYRYVPPMPISFIDQNGQFSLRPGVFGLKGSRDPVTLRQSYVQDTTRWT